MARSTPEVIRVAAFDPKLKIYMVLSTAGVLLITVVGIPLLPFWLAFAWIWWAPRYFKAISCELTERTLVVKRGVIFKVEKTVPLEKIQDMALRHGPLLNALGLASVTIETAGQSGGGSGQGDAVLHGVIDARGFRDAVMVQRDGLSEGPGTTPFTEEPRSTETAAASAESIEVMREIRDTLKRIEDKLTHPGAG